MYIASNHIDQGKTNRAPANKTGFYSRIKNSIIDFTSFLLLAAVSFSMIVALFFLAEVTTAGLLVSGVSHVLFG